MTTNERRRRAFEKYGEAYERYSEVCDDVKEYVDYLITKNGKNGYNGGCPYCKFAGKGERKEYYKLIARASRYEQRAKKIQAEAFPDFWED